MPNAIPNCINNTSLQADFQKAVNLRSRLLRRGAFEDLQLEEFNVVLRAKLHVLSFGDPDCTQFVFV